MNRIERTGSVSVNRVLFEFTLPSIIAMLSQSLCGIMERFYAGNGAGPSAIGGITLAFPVVAIFMAFSMMIGTGGAALYSIRMGEGKTAECRSIMMNCFFMLAASSLVLAAVTALFLSDILVLSGASGKSYECASEYLQILLLALPLQAVCFGMNNFVRSQGRLLTAMVTVLISSIGNIALSPLFIFMMNMGVKGIALGYLSAQFFASIHLVIYFVRSAESFPVPVHGGPGLSAARDIIVSGSGPFFMQLCAVAVSVSYNRQLLHYGGEYDICMFGIIRCVSVFLLMPALAICQASQPIIGCSHGSGNSARALKVFRRSSTASVLIPAAGVLAVLLFPVTLSGLFAGPGELNPDAGAFPFRIFVSMLPLAGLQVCAGGYFLATGRPVRSAVLTLSRQVVFLLPLLYILPVYAGINGVWIAQPVSDAASFVFTLIMLHAGRPRAVNGCMDRGRRDYPVSGRTVQSADLCCGR